MTRLRVGAYPEWPDITTVWTAPTHPPNVFRVTTVASPIVFLGYGIALVGRGLTGNRTINVNFGESEYGNAYLTSAEVTLMHAAQNQPPSGSIVTDLKGVLVSVLEPISGLMEAGAVTPRDDIIRLVPGVSGSNPFSLAHEWGHIVTWRSFDVSVALLDLAQYFWCDGLGDFPWTEMSNECERVAWMDGVAHMHGSMWMWTRSAPNPRIPRMTSEGAGMETPDESGECGAGISGHRRVICNARAMWDVVDRPTGDDDTLMTRDLGSVVEVMRTYARNCAEPFANGCVGEVGVDDMNWMDYRRNHINVYVDTVYLDIIGSLNDLQSSQDQ